MTVELELKANEIRKDIVAMIAEAGSGHPGGSLSCTDIMTALYFGGVLNYDASNPQMESRDRFVMAKGHAAPALYATLAHAGYFPREELKTLRKLGSRLQGHPDMNLLPGVEVSTVRWARACRCAPACAAACVWRKTTHTFSPFWAMVKRRRAKFGKRPCLPRTKSLTT